jgi:hypothetical protein
MHAIVSSLYCATKVRPMDRVNTAIASGAPIVHLGDKGERRKPTRRVQAGTTRFLAFPRVGCIASSAFPPRAWPCFVGRDQGHSFAPPAVLLRCVLTALHLLLGAKSRRFRYEPVSSCFRVGVRPRFVGGDRREHSFASFLVLLRCRLRERFVPKA